MPEERKSEPNAKKITSLLSISHDKDVDGLASAAIVWRYAKTKNLDFKAILTDYGSFEQVFSAIAKKRDTLIIITDLGMDDTIIDIVQKGLTKAISQGCRIVWLDHHQWSDNAIKMILSLGNKPVLKVNHEFCAAEITHKVLQEMIYPLNWPRLPTTLISIFERLKLPQHSQMQSVSFVSEQSIRK